MEFLKEWWPLGAAALTGLLGYNTAQTKTAHKLETMERRVQKAEEDIETLRNSRSADAISLGIIQSTLEQIKGLIADLRDEVRTKADK